MELAKSDEDDELATCEEEDDLVTSEIEEEMISSDKDDELVPSEEDDEVIKEAMEKLVNDGGGDEVVDELVNPRSLLENELVVDSPGDEDGLTV